MITGCVIAGSPGRQNLVDAAAGDIEFDDIVAEVRVRIENRLAQRPGPGIVSVDDGERGRGGGTREQASDRNAASLPHERPPFPKPIADRACCGPSRPNVFTRNTAIWPRVSGLPGSSCRRRSRR